MGPTCWLDRPRRRTLSGEIIFTYLAFLAYAFCYIWIMKASGVLAIPATGLIDMMFGASSIKLFIPTGQGLLQALQTNAAPTMFAGVIVAPILEETGRAFVLRFASDGYGRVTNRWAIYLFSGIVFGLLHGAGLFSIGLQGVLGMMLARLWFKNGPNENIRTVSCMVVHGLYNFTVIAMVSIFGT